MRMHTPFWLLLLLFTLTASGCQAIGDIFRAGFWAGAILVVIVVGIVVGIVMIAKR